MQVGADNGVGGHAAGGHQGPAAGKLQGAHGAGHQFPGHGAGKVPGKCRGVQRIALLLGVVRQIHHSGLQAGKTHVQLCPGHMGAGQVVHAACGLLRQLVHRPAAGVGEPQHPRRLVEALTGGIVTVKDSSWLLSWTLNRQQQFRDQPKNQLCVWVYGLFSDKPGDYVKKPMRDCTGREICMEWLYHIGVPEEDIAELAEHSANTVPVMMPYIDAFFMPRAFGDRPDIVPQGAVNFAFLGQFAETGRDTIFTTEYSMRTGMEAVYTLLNIDRGVPEVWGSTYDVRSLIDATVKLRDGKKITDMDLPFIQRVALKEVLKKIEGTDLEKFLKEYHAI